MGFIRYTPSGKLVTSISLILALESLPEINDIKSHGAPSKYVSWKISNLLTPFSTKRPCLFFNYPMLIPATQPRSLCLSSSREYHSFFLIL